MISLISLSIFIAFYTIYNTSKKATLTNNLEVEKWIQQNPKLSKIVSISIFIITYAIFISIKSIGAASLIYCIQIMTIGSLVIILAPLKILNYKTVLLFFALCITYEILFKI